MTKINHLRQEAGQGIHQSFFRVRIQDVRFLQSIEKTRTDFTLTGLLVKRPLVFDAVSDAHFQNLKQFVLYSIRSYKLEFLSAI